MCDLYYLKVEVINIILKRYLIIILMILLLIYFFWFFIVLVFGIFEFDFELEYL